MMEEEPTAMMEEEEEEGDGMMMWEVSDELKAYAAEHAGGPGAIYIGDGNFSALVGPSVFPDFMDTYGTDLGDDDGNVPLDAIEDVRWVFESDYYRQLIETANLTNPTELTSSGENVELQHTCINGQLLWCKHQRTYFVPNVQDRTDGQVTINITSFPELGLAGTDTATLLADGTLSMTEIYGGYVGGEFPTLAVQYIWGLWPDHETHYKVLTNIAPDLNKVMKMSWAPRCLCATGSPAMTSSSSATKSCKTRRTSSDSRPAATRLSCPTGLTTWARRPSSWPSPKCTRPLRGASWTPV